MLKVSRVLILATCAAFLATGSTLAQGAPPAPPGSPAPKAHHKNCKDTPKGCEKHQKKADKSTGGAPPAGGMPPPSPHP